MRVSNFGRQIRDLRGYSIERLRVPGEAKPRRCRGRIYWPVVCQCGRRKLVRSDHLLDHGTLSCSCWRASFEARQAARLRIHPRLRLVIARVGNRMRSRPGSGNRSSDESAPNRHEGWISSFQETAYKLFLENCYSLGLVSWFSGLQQNSYVPQSDFRTGAWYECSTQTLGRGPTVAAPPLPALWDSLRQLQRSRRALRRASTPGRDASIRSAAAPLRRKI